MSSEGVSGVIERLITSADETSSLDEVVSVVESRSREVLIDGVDFETFEGINRSNCVLPDISNNVVEPLCLEHIDRIWRQPVLKVDVTDLAVFPIV
jgi:hypothetical protein